MSCPECTAASQRPHFIFRSGCNGCAARDIARGPAFFHRNDSEETAREYRDVLSAAQLSPAAVMRASQADKERVAACQR